MICYGHARLLSKCCQQSLGAKLFKQINVKSLFPLYYSTRSLWIRKISGGFSSDFTWQHGITQHISCSYVHTTDTANKCPISEQLVYEGGLRKKIRLLKILTLTTSIGGLSVQPIVLNKVWLTSPYFAYSLGIFSTFFIVVTPLLIHLFTRRYVTELFFNPANKTFTAKTLTMFIREKKTTFTAEDVYVPTIPGFFTTFLVNNTPMFVDFESVIDVEAYQHLMGYDKPVDFHFEKPTTNEKSDGK